jgi:hypothetical protein
VFYLAAILIVAGVALFVAAPLGAGLIGAGAGERSGRDELGRFEHDRTLAMQALADLEFDREMDKLSEADYGSIRADLEERALVAMEGIDRLQPVVRPAPQAVRLASSSSPSPNSPASAGAGGARTRGKIRFCPQCGGSIEPAYRFCAQCGTTLSALLDSSREAG